MKEEKMIKMMQLNIKIPSITEDELRELKLLLKDLKCECVDKSECRGICSVEKRVSWLEKNLNSIN